MNNKLYKITGLVLISSVILSIVSMIMLGKFFDWESLSMGEALRLYYDSGGFVRLLWTLFGLGCFLICPLALLLHKVLNSDKTTYLFIGTTFGVISSLSYILGLTRWIMLAGMLSPMYSAPETTSIMKDVIETVFISFNTYAGNGFGETVAPITHGLWIIFTGSAMLKSRIFPNVIAYIQLLCGVIIMLRPLEYTGLPVMADIGDLGVQVWAILFLIVGVILIKKDNLTETY